MDIQFHSTESDYVAAQTAWLMRHPATLGRRGLFLLLALALFPIPLINLVVHPVAWRDTLPGLGIIAAWAAGSFVLVRAGWRKQFKESPLADADISATVDERGVTLSVRGEQNSHYWAGFSQIYESNRVVVLEKGPYGDFVYLPKSAMGITQLSELHRFALSAANCKVTLASDPA